MDTQNDNHNDTIFLRFIAILLIFNSHLGAYYPIEYLGTGGAIGNTLFFMLSSYGISLSYQRKPKKFPRWYLARIVRIYPSVWVTLLLIIFPIHVLLNKVALIDLLSFAGFFLCPPFWFLQALLIYYIIGWLILNGLSRKALNLAILLTIIAYGYLYLFHLDLSVFSFESIPIKLFYYFIVYLLGMHLAFNERLIKFSGFIDIVIATISFSIIYFHKFLMLNSIFPNFQFVQHLFMVILAFYLLKICRSSMIKAKLMKSYISKYIKYIVGLTLEIYIVHVSISVLIVYLDFAFPINVVLLLISTAILSIIVKNLSLKLVLMAA